MVKLLSRDMLRGDEALVVAEVEVGLGAVVGDEHLAVLQSGSSCPGSTLMYGSSFMIVTLRPRFSSSAPIDAEAMPLPSEETTPPVTKMNLVCFPCGRPFAIRSNPLKFLVFFSALRVHTIAFACPCVNGLE